MPPVTVATQPSLVRRTLSIALAVCALASCGPVSSGEPGTDDVAADAAPDVDADGELTSETFDGEDTAGGPAPELPPTPRDPDPRDPFFAPFQVPEISLKLADDALLALGDDATLQVQAEVTITQGDHVTGPLTTGLRLGGHDDGSYRPLEEKASFDIAFDTPDPEAHFQGLRGLTLRGMGRDKSMLRELLAYQLLRVAGVPSPRVGLATVRFNGIAYGLFTTVEPWGPESVADHVDSTGHLYVPTDNGQDATFEDAESFAVAIGDAGDQGDLAALIALVEETPDEALWEALQSVTDPAALTRFWAAEVLLAQRHGYAWEPKSYLLHSDASGRFTLLPGAHDRVLEDPIPWHSGGGALYSRCLGSAPCVDSYHQAHLSISEALSEAEILTFFDELAEFVLARAAEDTRKPYSTQEVHDAMQSLLKALAAQLAKAEENALCLNAEDNDLDDDTVLCSEDCDDENPLIYPGAEEICGDEVDEDCSGGLDDHPDCPDCEELWRGPHRYQVCTWPRTWQEGRVHCQEHGADLVIVSGKSENNWLRDAAFEIINERFWIGLHDEVTEGEFIWWDGSTPTWTRWAGGEPNDSGGEDCTEMYDNGRWNDLPCDAGRRLICEDVCPEGQDADGDGALRCGGDCDDDDPAFHPGADDLCDDGLDQDCDGTEDNGLSCTCSEIVAGAFSGHICLRDMSAQGAEEACADAFGETLAWFDSQAEMDAVVEAIEATVDGWSPAWIGANDDAEENLWVWMDGTPLGFTAWDEGQPNNLDVTDEPEGGDGEDCTRLFAAGHWHDYECGLDAYFLCRSPGPSDPPVDGGDDASAVDDDAGPTGDAPPDTETSADEDVGPGEDVGPDEDTSTPADASLDTTPEG